MNWTTVGPDVYVSMLAEPVATDHGVADRVIRVYDPRKGSWAVFLAVSNSGGRIGPIKSVDFEYTGLVLAEWLPSQWPPADPAQIATLSQKPAKGSIPARALRVLGGLVMLIAVLCAILVAAIVVIGVAFAVSPELAMGIFVALMIVGKVGTRRR